MPRIARWIMLLAAFALVPIIPAFATVEQDAPTVTFSWPSPNTVTCGSRPDLETLTVVEGTQVMVVNATAATATVVVGDEDVDDVSVDAGALLTLPPGVHVVTMVPACQFHSTIGELTVTVTAVAESTAPPSGATPDSGGVQAQGVPVQAPATTSGAGTRTPQGVVTPVAAPAGVPDGSASVPPSTISASGPAAASSEIAATTVDLASNATTPPSVVPVIALIFLLSVLAIIMRAIVLSRRPAKIEQQRTGQPRAGQRARRPPDDEGPASAENLRDRLRELVQAAHRGADPRQVEAARRELFAQIADVDRPTGTQP